MSEQITTTDPQPVTRAGARSNRTKLWWSAVGVVGLAAVVVAAVVAWTPTGADASQADASTSQAGASSSLVLSVTSPAAPSCGARELPEGFGQRLPAALRTDLQALAQADPAERPALWDQIRSGAVDGQYGRRVARVAETLSARVDSLPDSFTADVKALRGLDCEERRGQATEIADRALAGGYGPDVQQRAERLETLLERRGLTGLDGGLTGLDGGLTGLDGGLTGLDGLSGLDGLGAGAAITLES